MSIKGDIEELKNTWPLLSPLTKIFLVASLCVSALSVSSIADSIFKFRGFLRVGIDFYREFVAPIFSLLFEYLGLVFDAAIIDNFVFVTFISATLIRTAFVYRAGWFSISINLFVWFTYVYLIFQTKPQSLGIVFGFLTAIVLLAILPSLLGNLRKTKTASVYRISVLNIIATMLLVCIVAAISEALTKPL